MDLDSITPGSLAFLAGLSTRYSLERRVWNE